MGAQKPITPHNTKELHPMRTPVDYARAACDTMMRKFAAADLPPRGHFHYHQGVFLSGVLKTWQLTGEERYFQYAKDWLDAVIDEEGRILKYDHADLDGGFLGLLAAADGEAEDEQGKDEETNTHGEFSLDHPQDVRFQSEWPACTMFCSGTQLFSAAPLRRTAGTGPRARRHAH